jgi:hypothetical protein
MPSEEAVMRKRGSVFLLAMVGCLAGLAAMGAAAAGAVSFAPPVHYPLGGKPADLASADLNGDGRPDLVASSGSGLDVLLGVGRSGLSPASRIPLEHRPGAVTLADLDGSGTPDVVTANRDGTVTVLLGAGDGSFVIKGTYPSGASACFEVVAGDLTGDGAPDVATATGDGAALLAGDGSGGLLAPLRLPVRAECWHLAAGDFNLDGRLDLAASEYSWDDYSGFAVLLGDGAGGFSAPAFVDGRDSDSSPHGLAVCRLNRDSSPDLVALYGYEGGSVLGFLGDGAGGFGRVASRDFSGGLDQAWGLAVADLNRDGGGDVITIGQRPGGYSGTRREPPGPPRIYLLLSHVAGGVTFAPTSLLAGRVPGEVIAVDLNGDKRPDLATTDLKYRSLTVRLNGVLPALTGLSPARGRIGDVVTLTGRHFSLRHAVVRFGATTATSYVSRSDSKIVVRVPPGTARGIVNVTVTTLVGRSAPRSFLRLE